MTAILEKLERLRELEEDKQRVSEEAYFSLVVQLAYATEDPSLDDLQSVVAAAGKTNEDLIQDVRDCQRERETRNTAAIRDAALIERKEIDAKIVDANTALEAARQQHFATCRPLEIRKNEINQLVIAGGEADRWLLLREQKGENWISESEE